jgi:putative addiction module killer protein
MTKQSARMRCLTVMYPMGYYAMIEVRQTEVYRKWFDKLRDRKARSRILARVRRLSLGNPGDVKPVGEGVSELRIDYGPGYRVYFVQRGPVLVVLLAGGDKGTQDRDIKTALTLARGL